MLLYDDLVLNSGLLYDVLSSLPSGGDMSITNVDTDNVVRYLQADVVVTGSGFEAAQGTGSVTLGGVAQSVSSWSNTSITLTSIARGALQYGSHQLTVTNNSALSRNITVTLTPQTGWTNVVLGTLLAPGSRLTATPDLSAGDHLAYGNTLPSGTTVVAADGSFVVDNGVTSFQYEINDGTGWGTTGTQSINVPPQLSLTTGVG